MRGWGAKGVSSRFFSSISWWAPRSTYFLPFDFVTEYTAHGKKKPQAARLATEPSPVVIGLCHGDTAHSSIFLHSITSPFLHSIIRPFTAPPPANPRSLAALLLLPRPLAPAAVAGSRPTQTRQLGSSTSRGRLQATSAAPTDRCLARGGAAVAESALVYAPIPGKWK